jgi:SAM-dependent methyltransferase
VDVGENVNTLDYIQKKFSLDLNQQKMPIPIPNFGRNQLADLLHELDFKDGVEVGVAAGEYSEILCEANPKMKLYGVDPWKPLEDYVDTTDEHVFEITQKEAENRLKGYTNYSIIYKTSMEAVKDFEDNSLDFAYIDGNHNFQNVTNDINEWIQKIRSGGLIAGHDYFRSRGHPETQVIQAVNTFADAHKIKPWFVLGNEADNEGLIRDKPRSWMWVKA